MRSSRQGRIPSELADLVDELDDIQRRLRILEAPSAEALGNTVAKLSALVADIQAELDAYLAGRYTNAQIDAKDAARAPLVHTHDQSQVTGTWDKGVATGAGISASGAILFPNAYATDITWTRRTGWWGNDGRAGYASSSRTKKTSIRPADEKALLALLDVDIFDFIYRAEIRRRTSKRINEGVDYVPDRELGLMAEDLDAAGLGFFVYHDDDGNAEGIEYGMLTIALLAIAREQRAELDALGERVDEIERTRG